MDNAKQKDQKTDDGRARRRTRTGILPRVEHDSQTAEQEQAGGFANRDGEPAPDRIGMTRCKLASITARCGAIESELGSRSERFQAVPFVPAAVRPAARNAARAAVRCTPISGRCGTSVSRWKRARRSAWWDRTGAARAPCSRSSAGFCSRPPGRVVTRGRIAALLELGAGFNPEFSGRENVYLNGEIMGLSRAEIEKAMPSIESFAEIGEFMERPVKEYSSGMYVRLAFSTAIHVDPGDSDRRRSAGGGRRRFRQPVRAKIPGTAGAQDHGPVRLARSGSGEAAFRPGDSAAERTDRGRGRAEGRHQPVHRAGAGTAGAAEEEETTAWRRASAWRRDERDRGGPDSERERRGDGCRSRAASR